MKRDNKQKLVSFADIELKTSYEKLKTGKYESIKLYEFIQRAINDLKRDPSCGIHIPKRLIPKDYIARYEVTNL